MSFWQNLDARERFLVGLLGVIAAVFLIWMLGLRPLAAAKAQTARAQMAAMNDYRIVANGAPQISVGSNGALAAFDRSALVTAARTSQLPISRVQPGQNGELRVWFDDVPSNNVFNLLSRIASEYDVTVTRAQINRRDDNTVSAQFTFTPN